MQARAAAVPDIYSWAAADPAVPVAGCIANMIVRVVKCSDEGVTLTLEHVNAQVFSTILYRDQ